MQLNEGCVFRLNIDADWLETDVIAIEFRLLSRVLPDEDPHAKPALLRQAVLETPKEVRNATFVPAAGRARTVVSRILEVAQPVASCWTQAYGMAGLDVISFDQDPR